MLGMGLTLTLDDFARVLTRPGAVAAGCLAQFAIMPAAGWAVATLSGLEPPLAVGLILVGSCPGGTASNVVAYLARADVPLSVVMTACTTAAAVVLTPLFTKVLAGQFVEVDATAMFLSTLQVVVAPVAAGIVVNRWLPDVVRAVQPVAPLVSVVTIALVVGSVIAQNAAAVRASGPRLLGAVVALHAVGFGLGYLAARLAGHPAVVARTISIEVGMQNSGLGVVLARRHFPTEPLTAVPCAISAVTHSVLGSLLAAVWRVVPVVGEATASLSESSPSADA